MSRWNVYQTIVRVTASGLGETWIYQFPPSHWKSAVKKIMADAKAGALPDDAAGGLLELIAEGVADDD